MDCVKKGTRQKDSLGILLEMWLPVSKENFQIVKSKGSSYSSDSYHILNSVKISVCTFTEEK